jgi:glycosyltransferase involved in cell wall biosynthesis
MESAKPKILIITPYSFGYSSLPYNWCRYLTEHYDMTCLCLEDILKREPLTVKGVKVTYVHAGSGRLSRYASFLLESFRTVRKGFDLCIVSYFPGCALIKLLNPPRRKFILNIQSGAIGTPKIKRIFDNRLLRLEASFFRNKFVLSESLRRKLYLSSTAHVIPIGASTISDKARNFNRLDLLYVGTLQNRNIDKTIKGFAQFHVQYKDKIGISYTVIGNGYRNEEDELKKLVREKGLDGVVTIAGYVARNKLEPFFDEANVGVSFIPMTDYYDVQPPTKTFEYLLSGMPVLATNTSENRCLIDNTNGVLIEDTPDGFYQGLKELYARRHSFNSEKIRARAQDLHTWEHITTRKLIPFFNAVLQANTD